MNIPNFNHNAVSICAIAAILQGCGALRLAQNDTQAPIGVSGAVPQRVIGDAIGYKILHRFNGRNGEAPLASLLELKGTLYGTTSLGGAHGDGTVFSITSDGAEHLLHNFGPLSGSDGVYPAAALIAVNGRLYGTTADGGHPGGGTFFSVTTRGAERVLHDFGKHFNSPSSPAAPLIEVNGTLYTTSDDGGDGRYNGTVFEIDANGKVRTLYSFGRDRYDGAFPSTGVLEVNGILYGTTYLGGRYGQRNLCSGPCPGYGTIFSLTQTGTERVMHSFGKNSDGVYPEAPLTNVKGVLYGTTFTDRVDGPPDGAGTVFRMDTRGTEEVLYTFKGGADGANPAAGLIYVDGILYGTTQNGGNSGDGTIFSLQADGSGERVLHSFGGGGDGARPVAGLLDVNGTLYGTTSKGGGTGCQGAGCGTVFAFTP
jgi:uncharacterized repeat protein (TIGR03803 family)